MALATWWRPRPQLVKDQNLDRIDWLTEYSLMSMKPSKDYRRLHRLKNIVWSEEKGLGSEEVRIWGPPLWHPVAREWKPPQWWSIYRDPLEAHRCYVCRVGSYRGLSVTLVYNGHKNRKYEKWSIWTGGLLIHVIFHASSTWQFNLCWRLPVLRNHLFIQTDCYVWRCDLYWQVWFEDELEFIVPRFYM